MSLLHVALGAMLLQQAFGYVCQLVLPILAPEVADALGISPEWLGLFQFLTHSTGIVAAMACGGFIVRYGALRVAQVTLALMAGGVLLAGTGMIWLMPIAAMLLGLTYGSTPSSSHILARLSPPHLAPLIFSIKQAAVPVGSLVAGYAVPAAYTMFGLWGAFVATAIASLAFAALLQVLRPRLDDDRKPDHPLSFGDVRATVTSVLASRALRGLALTAFSLGGLQAVFATFFVTFLIRDIDFTLAAAGELFGISGAVALVTRIIWGWLGGLIVGVRPLVAGLTLGGAASAFVMALVDPSWPWLAVAAVAIAYNATAISWHGILIAEVARLAPEGRVGAMVGGILACNGIGMMSYPALFGVIAGIAGHYGVAFAVLGVPALVVGLLLACERRETQAT